MLAVKRCHSKECATELVKILIDAGADKNTRYEGGKSAVLHAVNSFNAGPTKVLFKAGFTWQPGSMDYTAGATLAQAGYRNPGERFVRGGGAIFGGPLNEVFSKPGEEDVPFLLEEDAYRLHVTVSLGAWAGGLRLRKWCA